MEEDRIRLLLLHWEQDSGRRRTRHSLVSRRPGSSSSIVRPISTALRLALHRISISCPDLKLVYPCCEALLRMLSPRDEAIPAAMILWACSTRRISGDISMRQERTLRSSTRDLCRLRPVDRNTKIATAPECPHSTRLDGIPVRLRRITALETKIHLAPQEGCGRGSRVCSWALTRQAPGRTYTEIMRTRGRAPLRTPLCAAVPSLLILAAGGRRRWTGD